jgi:hypothetical protein
VTLTDGPCTPTEAFDDDAQKVGPPTAGTWLSHPARRVHELEEENCRLRAELTETRAELERALRDLDVTRRALPRCWV